MAVIVILWLVACVLGLPSLMRLSIHQTAGGQLMIVGMMFFFMVFWSFGSYHLVIFVFNALRSTESVSRHVEGTLPNSPVALLYVTSNDFDPIALRSCLLQDYEFVHIFVLDDSTRPEIREEIDRFTVLFPDNISLVRRASKDGHKAGNLNYALRGPARDFSIFGVVDADTVLSPCFVRELLPRLLSDQKLAYVQASCRARKDIANGFARAIAPCLDLMWLYYMPYRREYGFVPFLGKGALIRRDAWVAVGGFPEIIAEDVGFSLGVRQSGYRASYCDLPLVSEGLPKSQAAFVDQQCKYAVGACQLLWRARSSLSSMRLCWFEFIDLVFLLVANILPAISFLFLLLSVLLLPLMFYELHFWSPLTFAGSRLQIPFFSPAPAFASMLDWRLRVISALSVTAPILGAGILGWDKWGAKATFISQASVAHLSALPQILCKTIMWSRKAHFASTGDRARLSLPITSLFDLILIVGMIAGAFLTANAQMGAIALAISLARGENWNGRHWPLFLLPILLVLLSIAVFAISGGLPPVGGGTFLVPIHF